MLRTTFAITMGFLACAACSLAQASLVNHNDGSFTDTGTGYVWRTLDQYDGLDYASAVAVLPAGYHAATPDELATLTAAAPADPARFGTDAAAMGAGASGIIWGYYGDGNRYAWKDGFDTSWNTNTANPYGWTDWNYAVTPSVATAGLSLFAVNTAVSAVPEPAAGALLAVGCLLIAGAAGRRRRGKPHNQIPQ